MTGSLKRSRVRFLNLMAWRRRSTAGHSNSVAGGSVNDRCRIPAHNEERHIRACLESVVRGNISWRASRSQYACVSTIAPRQADRFSAGREGTIVASFPERGKGASHRLALLAAGASGLPSTGETPPCPPIGWHGRLVKAGHRCWHRQWTAGTGTVSRFAQNCLEHLSVRNIGTSTVPISV